ncbi:MAG: flippase-like domain-containing protein [Gammaproteobacteria bacterium]|nr:flippase-like domain-containing protein [Gammaproteobacteria bacterium]
MKSAAKSPLRRSAAPLLKAVLVIGLVIYVLTSIDWRDNLISYDEFGFIEYTKPVTVVGGWNRPDVTVRTDSGEKILVSTSAQSATVKWELTPGLITYIKNCSALYISLAFLLVLSSVLFGSARWWWLLRTSDVRIPAFDALRYTFIGIFGNNFVPGQTGGDLVKAIYIMRRCPDSKLKAFVSVVVDRLLGLASLVLLATIAITWSGERFHFLAVGIWSVLAAGLVVGAALFSRRLRAAMFVDLLLKKTPDRIRNLLQQIEQAIHLYRGRKLGVCVWVAAGILNHAVLITAVMVLGYGLGVGVPVSEYFVLVPIINLVSAIPIAPQGWGIGEALYSNLFAAYEAVHLGDIAGAEQIMRTRAVALSLVYRVVLTVISLLGGLVLLGEKHRVTAEDVERESAGATDID